ncbi:hypothetical protein M1614_02215 [Candidatus Marsarchaeota archaeon]|jgi:hypothetical protein|nr:hypothetical protein [Candidatus Marsarchaeota archaeon]
MLEYVRGIYKAERDYLFVKILMLCAMSLIISMALIRMFPAPHVFAYYVFAAFAIADILISFLLASKRRNSAAAIYRLAFYTAISAIALAVII